MKKNDLTLFLIFAFLALGASGLFLRWHITKANPPADLDRHWRITYTIKFRTVNTGTQCCVTIPSDNAGIRIIRESFSHSQMGVTFKQNPETLQRQVFLMVGSQKADSVRFEAQFDLIMDEKWGTMSKRKEDLNPKDRIRYLHNEEWISINNSELINVLEKLQKSENNRENLVARIFEYCSKIVSASKEAGKNAGGAVPTRAGGVLEHPKATGFGPAQVMVALCRAAGIPSRLVTGLLLSTVHIKQPHHWVELYEEGHWVTYDPAFPGGQNIKPLYLRLSREKTDIIEVTGARNLFVSCGVKQIISPSGISQAKESTLLSILDFTRLPPKMADAIALVLLLPLGGLITAVFRHIFKIETFGYFTTTLIALSFTDVQWQMGIIVFIVITSIGLLGRFIINRLNLHKLPRITLVLIFVVFSLSLTVSILDFFDVRPSSRGVLLPMISLTMMIEKFSIRIEENGYQSAFKKLGATLLVAFCCLLIFQIEHVQWFLLTFPEAEFFIGAALVLVGRYKREEQDLLKMEPSTGVMPEAKGETNASA